MILMISLHRPILPPGSVADTGNTCNGSGDCTSSSTNNLWLVCKGNKDLLYFSALDGLQLLNTLKHCS